MDTSHNPIAVELPTQTTMGGFNYSIIAAAPKPYSTHFDGERLHWLKSTASEGLR